MLATRALPEGVEVLLAFCPTGEGGGVDPSCPSGKGAGGGSASGKSYEADVAARKKSQAGPPLPAEPKHDALPVPAPAEPNVYKPWEAVVGMTLYHASPDAIDELDDDRPMWFTPSRKEAQAYLSNSEGDDPHSYQTQLKVDKFAPQAKAASIAASIFGEDEPFSYSMLDPAVGEHDEEDVHKFVSALKAEGFAGVIHSDYSAVNQDRDAYTLIAFNPRSSTTGLKPSKGIKLAFPCGVELAFCPTGPGGGVDPTCGSGSGKSGGSVVKARKRFEPSKNAGETTITDVQTFKVMTVKGGDALPQKLVDALASEDTAQYRVVYDVKDDAWHIPSKNLHEVDHGNFAPLIALRHKGEWPDLTQVRGVLDVATRTVTLYDLTGEAESIAGWSGKTEKSVLGTLKTNIAQAKRKLLYLGKRKLKADSVGFNPFEMSHHLPDGVELAFCPTGPGGGVDPTCGSAPKVSASDVKVLNSNIGGTQGAKLVEWQGKQYVAKDYKGDRARVAVEHLANKFYDEFSDVQGTAPKSQVVKIDGKDTLMTEFIPGTKTLGSLKEFGKASASAELSRDFVLDAFLANWDVVGQDSDNVLVDDSASADAVYRVDNGGSLIYRAQGGLKGSAFGPAVGELESMRDPKRNLSAARVFKNVDEKTIAQQARRLVKDVTPDHIRALVDSVELDSVTKADISKRLIARRYWLMARYPE